MIIKRKLFSRKKNLTPEQERERDLRDKVFKNEVSKLGISHYFDKGTGFRDKQSSGIYSKFTGTYEEEKAEIENALGVNKKERKRRLKALNKGKSGIIAYDPKAPFHVQIHEPGHPAAIKNAKSEEDKRIADIGDPYEGVETPKRSMSDEELRNIQKDIEKRGNDVVKREELANSEARKMLERQGATKEELEKFDKDRIPDLNTYKNSSRQISEKSFKVIEEELNRRKRK